MPFNLGNDLKVFIKLPWIHGKTTTYFWTEKLILLLLEINFVKKTSWVFISKCLICKLGANE